MFAGNSTTSVSPSCCIYLRTILIRRGRIAAVQESGCGGQRKKSVLTQVIKTSGPTGFGTEMMLIWRLNFSESCMDKELRFYLLYIIYILWSLSRHTNQASNMSMVIFWSNKCVLFYHEWEHKPYILNKRRICGSFAPSPKIHATWFYYLVRSRAYFLSVGGLA